jgi:hypothetical protein
MERTVPQMRDARKDKRLPHPNFNRGGAYPEILKAESQLIRHGVGTELTFGILEYKADPAAHLLE